MPWHSGSFPDGVNGPRAIAVRNDTGIWHPDSEGILAFFHVAWVDA
jgi:hypothetical protein